MRQCAKMFGVLKCRPVKNICTSEKPFVGQIRHSGGHFVFAKNFKHFKADSALVVCLVKLMVKDKTKHKHKHKQKSSKNTSQQPKQP